MSSSSAVALVGPASPVGAGQTSLTTPQTPASFWTLPKELRDAIYEMVIVARGTIDIDLEYQVDRTASRSTVVPRINAVHFEHSGQYHIIPIPCFQTPGSLDILLASRRFHAETLGFFYKTPTFRIASLPTLELFLNTIVLPNQSVLSTLELNAGVLEGDFFDNIDTWTKLWNLTNLSNLLIAIDSDVLDIFAAQNEPFRTRFASKWPLPGPWWDDTSIEQAEKQLHCLHQVAWSFVGQAEDTAGKRERFKILRLGRFVGPRARYRARQRGPEALQSKDYDEIEAGILFKIERDPEDAGCFA